MAYGGYSKLKVLVVDDFDNFRMTVSKMLQQFGVPEIDTASAGGQAIQMCRNKRYDLVLCDYNLGKGKTGQQVLEDIRAENLLHSSALFVLVSADSSRSVVMAAFDCEPDDYLAKPVTTMVLKQRLQRLLVRRATLGPIYRAMAAGQTDVAIALCRKEIEADGRYSGSCQKLLGRIYRESGEFDQAEGIYRRVLDRRALDWALTGMGEVRKDRGDFDGARDWLEQAIEVNPLYMKAYDLRADICREEGSNEQLQQALEESVRVSPLSIQRQQQLADVALKNNDIATAAGAYKRAVRLSENSCYERGEDYLNLARTTATLWNEDKELAKSLTREATKALAEYEQRFGRTPDLKLRKLLAESQLVTNAGDSIRGGQLLGEAQTLMEKEPAGGLDADIELVKSYTGLGEKQKAQSLLNELVRRCQGDEESLQKLDRLLEVPVSERNKQLVADLNTRGIGCYEVGDYSGAIEEFKIALRKFPLHLGVRLNMAQAEIDQMQVNGAGQQALADAYETLKHVEENIDSSHEQFRRFRQLQDMLKQIEYQGSA